MDYKPLYGRKWRIIVINKDGSTAWDLSDNDFEQGKNVAVRCVFHVEQLGYQESPWFADVQIWNLEADTEKNIRRNAARVIIEAGYVNGNYGKIFDGDIFQPTFDRDNVTDFVTGLVCIDGMGLMTSNLANATLAAGYDYYGILDTMAKNARNPIAIDKKKITPNLAKKSSPRGKVIYGEPRKFIRDLCRDNGAQSWVANGQLHIGKMDEVTTGEAISISPESGLIGTPQQGDYGVNFKCLLNAGIKVTYPVQAVKLDMSIIRQQKAKIGELITPLDQDGIYKVAKVSHLGDTRGNDWYTEVTGVNKDFPLLGALGS